MKKIPLLIVVLFALVIIPVVSYAQNAPQSGDAAFFETLPDVPMMDGMEERQDLTFIFDKPEGRIIETLAHLDGLNAEQIRSYYSNTLPQLGWRKNANDEFVRETEKLSMQFEKDFLKITIEPR